MRELTELRTRLREIQDLRMAAAVLQWDQATYMPPGGAPARGRQMALLARLAHERLTAPRLRKLLDHLETGALDPASDDGALVRVTRRDVERAVRLPAAFVKTVSEHQSATYEAWTKARPANDFARLVPLLERTLELSRQVSDYLPGYAHPIDALIDEADPGMTAAVIRELFAALRRELVPLVQAITAQPPADDGCLKLFYPQPEQLAVSRQLAERLGYDFDRGRLDLTPHPFMTTFDLDDVRILTRVNEHHLSECLFGVLHETGHALYEQGIAPALAGTPLASGTSCAVHESQSRLWENQIGRGRLFWQYAYPLLQRTFPSQLGEVKLETFYRAINKVERSLIRVEADEVTYNLHVMIRFDLECAMLEGKLSVKELPAAWNARYQSDLGLTPPDDRHGVMQDVHWYGHGIGGYFQGYTLGNLMSAQIAAAARRALPSLEHDLANGQFTPLREWLTTQLYRHGRKLDAAPLVQQVTGQPLGIAAYVAYLRTKYGELYALPPA